MRLWLAKWFNMGYLLGTKRLERRLCDQPQVHGTSDTGELIVCAVYGLKDLPKRI
jgi:hypothetical protein